MQKLLSYLNQWLPKRFKGRRFLLDHYHFDMTSFEGDVGEWLDEFPINENNVEIYFALAELFRRRGEFDKAVSIHEAISKAQLPEQNYSEITLEIAQDYYAAGMLGHAEEVLVEALEHADEDISRQAFRLWLAILESEQDWDRAVHLVEEYGIPGSGGLRLANFYCEYIEQLRREKPSSQLQKILRKALRLEVSARAAMLNADLLTQMNAFTDAIQSYREILQRDPRRTNLALKPLRHLSELNDSLDAYSRFLAHLYVRHPSVRILEMLIDCHGRTGSVLPQNIQDALEEQVRKGESDVVFQFWLARQSSDVQSALQPLVDSFLGHSLDQTDEHVCLECGFRSEKMVWQCPQCSSWETLYSRYELKIEQQLKKVT